MAGAQDANLDETPRWRLSILFFVIVLLSLVGHIGLHLLEEYFRKHQRKGLKHTMQSLKDELFALGLITLLLITLQDQLVKICISGDSNNYGKEYGYTYGGNRKLLAGSGGNYECPGEKESFWSVTAMHEIHILIFLIALVHLLQAASSMVLASLRVRKWKDYERRECHDMVPLKRKRAIKPKGSWCALWMQSFFTQFSDSVDGPVYLAIRRLFLEKLELDDDFNFYSFVMDCMEEDFAKLVEFQWMMWLIAAIWILLPWQIYTVIWLPCLCFVVMVIVGAKLQSIAIQLATLAYTHYTPSFIPHKDRKKSRRSSLFKSMLTQKSNKKIMHEDGCVNREQVAQDASCSDMGAVEETISVNGSEQFSGRGQSLPRLSANNKSETSDVRRIDKTISQSQHFSKLMKPPTQLADYLAQTRLLKDSSQLFWFGKPKIVLRVFQYVYFQSGFSIALLILDEWRGQQVNHLQGHILYVVMIGVNLFLMVHAALFVIPTYAITIAAGAYGQENVLKKAIKRNVNPNLAKKLDGERKQIVTVQLENSFTESVLAITTKTEHPQPTSNHDQSHTQKNSHEHGHHDGGRVINQLLQAMEQSQIRKKKLEQHDALEFELGIGKYYKSESKNEPENVVEEVGATEPAKPGNSRDSSLDKLDKQTTPLETSNSCNQNN